jgi:hypothetical protein
MTRGLFRLWLVASLIWVIMLLPGLWGGTRFPAFTSADNVWFETTHHNFDNTSYVYTPDGKPKPRGTHDDLAWGDEEYDHKIGTDETIKLHKLSSDEKVWDATYTDLTSPDNLNLWVPLDLAASERQRVLDTFTTRYVHGIAYEEASWPPGLHRILAKRYGAKGTTLPIVLDGDTVIQGRDYRLGG